MSVSVMKKKLYLQKDNNIMLMNAARVWLQIKSKMIRGKYG